MSEFECRKENKKCVCINVYVKCEKKDACEGEFEECCKEEDKDECCVELNIFAECEK